ncbi:MAG: TolC family protein [Fischerella sp.]|nr:TolC family protein [Fischerella sp.]
MKGQIILHSFLPGVTAAVLTTQPTWAQQVVYPSFSGTIESGNFVAENTRISHTADNKNFASAIAPASGKNNQPLKSKNPGATAIPAVDVPIGKNSGKDERANSSLTPTSHQTQQLEAVSFNSAGVLSVDLQPKTQQITTLGGAVFTAANQANVPEKSRVDPAPMSVRQRVRNQTSKSEDTMSSALARERLKTLLKNRVIPTGGSTAKTILIPKQPLLDSAFEPPVAVKPNLDTKFSPSLQKIVKGSGAAKLLEVQNCSQYMTVSFDSPGCLQQNSTELLAQTPPTAPAAPSPKVPVVPPTPKSPVAPAPNYLNPNPNPLQFPTKPDEVKQKGIQPITLEQAVELAQRNNTDLRIALLELERARAAVREAQAALFPTLDFNAQINRQQSPSSQLQAERLERAQRGLPEELRESSPDEAITTFTGTAQLVYNLYTSGRRLANIGAAEEQERLQELDVLRRSEEIRLNVTQNYYDLQQADENVRIAQSAVRNAEVTLRDAQALERAGVGTQFDVLRAQVTLANAQQDLSQALSQQATARSRLATTLNIPGSLSVSAADPVKLAGLWNPTLEETIVLAYQNRPELQQRLAERNISQQRRRLALAEKGPQVSLVASYNLLDQFDDQFGVTDGYSLGVQASLNLFDGGSARARADQQTANIKIAETQFSDTRNQIRFQVEQAYAQLRTSLDQVQTANIALEQAREALRLARLRFQAGVGTQTDVIAAENDLTRAEGNSVEAILNYNRALATLQRSVTARGLGKVGR